MENNENNENRPLSFEDFLDLYPKIELKKEYSPPTDKFLNYFNIKNRTKRRKSSVILDNNQITQLINSKNFSRLSSFKIKSKVLDSLRNNDRNKINSKNKFYSNKHNYKLYKIQENEEIDKCIDLENEDLFLINKGLELQKRGLKRSNDVKKALELFFHKSELIEKLKQSEKKTTQENYNDQKKEYKNKRNSIENNNQYKINNLIAKLAEYVIFEKYEKNKFIMKMNDIGRDCYFLISGKLSILKPVEYKHIKITYEDYFKYLLNLLEKKENGLLKKVLELNWHFINIYDEDNLISIIKYYIQNRISVYSNTTYNIYERDKREDLTLEKIELLLNEYKMKLEDFGLTKNKIISDINNIFSVAGNKNPQFQINEYFKQIFQPSRQSQIVLSQYNFLFDRKAIFKNEDNKNKNKNFVTLFKYENFLILEPGAFFGEMSLEKENGKRNASIRTEEDSILVSLNIEQYENLLLDDNKKIKIIQVNFLCNNFFFHNISPKLFIKYYYPMFKFITKKKNEIIYKQESNCNSLFLLKEGIIKYEIFASIVDIHDLIIYLINSLLDNKNLNYNKDNIQNLKEKYLVNNNLITFRNNNIILNEKINKRNKFELSISNSYEVLGIYEFFLNIGHVSTCYVVSKEAKFFEIDKNSLDKIISIEKEIIGDYYQLAHNKILALIKRLFNIENIFIKQTQEKINSNFFDINDTNFFMDLKEEKKLSTNFNNNDKYNLDQNENDEENKIINNNSINSKDELILSEKFENYGHIEESIIKNNNKSQIQFENEQKNLELLRGIKDYENNSSFISFNRLSELKRMKSKKYGKKEKRFKNSNNSCIINKNKRHNFFDLNINSSSSINYNKNKDSYNYKNSNSFRSAPKTIINIGNSYLSLPKLKKKILFNKDNLENKSLNLSIVKNDLIRKNIFFHNSKINQINNNFQKEIYINNYNSKNYLSYNNKDNSLPNFKKLDSPGLNSFVSRIKKNINLSKIKRNSESKANHSKEINIHTTIKKVNILAKYIKNFYQKQKNKGYSAIINPYSNSMIRHKFLNNNSIKEQ